MDDDGGIERLRQEVHRLNTRLHFLEEENDDLRRRVAFLGQELERTRAKITGPAIPTS
jgi:chromosome segregation ATPase